ncbi:CG14795 [Drosophila busckii]|uniref:CG14795 n=1 Tax=Drosophila busckii TaxID=30019 RepID=A0A0M4ESJ1_DROBS|nr:uncharacterized protein LOC108606483 [Drosophila busckii]ALC48301.1 CG14795 [Drosophila busckii]
MFSSKQCLVVVLAVLLTFACVQATPMLYRRNPDEKYEADLVAVSSTVIPLTVLEVSYGVGGKPSEEYKAAYIRKLRQQVLRRKGAGGAAAEAEAASIGEATITELLPATAPSDADALITVKSRQKAQVKATN